jgi:hypothetical protein
VANGIEDLARRMLNAAWRRRTNGFIVPDVISPRDQQVAREMGYDEGHSAEELWRVEQWLEERRYIVPANMVGRGKGTMLGDFYTITPEGHAFREGAD